VSADRHHTPGLLVCRYPLSSGSFSRRQWALPSSRVTPLSACPALRPRWCPLGSPYRPPDCCFPTNQDRQLSPGVLQRLDYPLAFFPARMTTTIHISGLNHAARSLALPLLRTPHLWDRTSVRLPACRLRFGLWWDSHPLGNINEFQYVCHTLPSLRVCLGTTILWLEAITLS
jgi:hypothetical protein